MALIDVIDVGQGDCIVINPPLGCNFYNKCIMIDTGDGSRDITDCIGDKKVCLFITHHDRDHFGGLKYFIGNNWNKLEKIVLPFYQNELTLIAKAMLNLKGNSNAVDCEQFIDYFNDIVNNQMFLKSIAGEQKSVSRSFKHNTKQIQLCCEGDLFCNHIKCLNPPRYSNDNWSYVEEYENMEKVVEEIFNEDFAKNIKIYLSACRRGNYYIDSRMINNLFLYLNDDEFSEIDRTNLNNIKYKLFFDFINANIQAIREFNANPVREKYKAIYNTYKQTSHDVCMVLKLNYEDESILLTGDASKKVFYRLIDEKVNIKSDYLKVPHHGSRKNLDEEILSNINPRVAIISHNNRRFGTSTDSHPNWEVLYMLKEQGAKLIITNDVVKDGEIVIKKCNNLCDKYIDVKDAF